LSCDDTAITEGVREELKVRFLEERFRWALWIGAIVNWVTDR